ncbi:MAG: succinate dehydrogenase, cytochrome b556 subunit [Candidatus Kapabacteria bacterium]|nr:succinate dehydrogenase, cytochrome b556 subunit [Candidatus Kapabacteria bacterium]MDW8225957.1 succinate dehydrogenase, cytochrome b556 subunit [Bacteroidota bacterium]
MRGIRVLESVCRISLRRVGTAGDTIMAYLQQRSPIKTWWENVRRYRWHAGLVAWVLHRITGLALLGYLFVHIWALRTLVKGSAAFEAEMQLFTTPFFKVAEWLLFAVVLFHALNGIRIALVDFSTQGAYRQRLLLHLVYGIGVAMMLLMGVLIFLDPFAV